YLSHTKLSLYSTFHVLAGTESSSIRQESGLMSANVGDTLVLHCFHESDMAVLFSWYKQTLGDKLQLFSTVNKYDRNATFYHEFKDNPRFSVENGQEKNHLRISDMQLSDSGTYYCGSSYSNKMEFGEGAILIVKDPLLLVYCLGVALALLFILIIVLACIMYKMYKRKCRGKLLKSFVSQTRGPTVSQSDAGAQDGDSLHYVALNLSNNKNRSRRQRNTMEEETVYSGIRQ
uniref:Ig-like domain-containing protein n=1 Tax=Salmo trutta TaxID=8032 RepID=A0A673VKD7_SALTR